MTTCTSVIYIIIHEYNVHVVHVHKHIVLDLPPPTPVLAPPPPSLSPLSPLSPFPSLLTLGSDKADIPAVHIPATTGNSRLQNGRLECV